MKKDMKEMDSNLIFKPATELYKSRGETIKQLSFLGKGEGSAVYKIETSEHVHCLKTALFPRRTQKVLNEAKIRQDFIDKGLTFVPPPLFTDQAYFKDGAVIYEYIDGEETVFDSQEILAQMASHLAAIHKLEVEIIPNGIDQIWKNYQSLDQTTKSLQSRYAYLVNQKISQAFSMALAEYKSQIENNLELFSLGISSILHGDISDNCVTDTEGKLWLIDWENSEYGDVVEEICTFVYYSIESENLRDFFIQEYQKHFPSAKELDFKRISEFYLNVNPVYNICWGIDQLHANLEHKLEPERKLRDILKSAKNWSHSFSKTTAEIIVQGVNQMIEEISKKL